MMLFATPSTTTLDKGRADTNRAEFNDSYSAFTIPYGRA